jgi:hypothetical protein
VSWPEPRPGLVIRYAYLWQREHDVGREEGVKDRPCAIVLAFEETDGEKTVYVLPITHAPPVDPDDAIELPPATKARLGLDSERSWIVVSEGNRFIWPGPDLRFAPGQGPESAAYGMLPPALFRIVRQRFFARVQARRAGVVRRSE